VSPLRRLTHPETPECGPGRSPAPYAADASPLSVNVSQSSFLFDNAGWTWIGWHVAEDEASAKEPNDITRTPAANVERMLAPLAHEARIRIMQTLYLGPKSSGELSEATGLKGGNLYYHLKELMHAAYVAASDFAYDITPLGCQMLITVASIAGKVVADRGEQGLMVTSGGWEG
jgi:DNA-binding transcriptional ArsR family regulator